MNIQQSLLEVLEANVASLKTQLSFSEYILKEAKQVGYIYHFTTLSNIEKIIKSNKIEKGKEGYVSLTRDFQLPNYNGYFNSGEYIVRITIDGNKLSENTKIKPISDKSFNDEREDGVAESINLKYIKQIDILYTDTRVFSNTAINAVCEVIKNKYDKINLIKKFQPVKG